MKEANNENSRLFNKHKAGKRKVKTSYNVGSDKIVNIIREKFVFIPLSVFKNTLAPLESVVLFLKDHLGLSFHKIGLMLNRDDRTIWVTYRNAIKKKIPLITSSQFYVPAMVLSDRGLSVLESVVEYLSEKEGLSLKQICELTGKSYKTIWTVDSRAKKKRKNESKK
tara:strand:- start:483 stop:983 length:501 start_codon:yes stop_codon:yes gene_type:complete